MESLLNVLAEILVYSPIRRNDLEVHGTYAFYGRIGHGNQANQPCLRRGINRAPVTLGTTAEARLLASRTPARVDSSVLNGCSYDSFMLLNDPANAVSTKRSGATDLGFLPS